MVNIDKIKSLTLNKGWSLSFLCSKLGKSTSYFNDLRYGKAKISDDRLIEIANLLDTTPEYLKDETEIKEKPLTVPKSGKGKWIPVLGRVAAGIPIEAIEDIIDYEEISEKMAAYGDYFALEIHGQSMEPKMSEGDVVIVRKQEYADTGDTVIVLVNGSDATCKKIKFTDKGIVLIPSNPAFEPMYFSKEDIETLPVQVIGKVVELRAKY